MNAEQKRAWFSVITGMICLVGYVVLIPFVGPMMAMTIFALFGITGLAPLIGRKETTDERDRSIGRRATLGGAMASYGAFLFGCMGVWTINYHWLKHEQVSIHVLPNITFFGVFALFFVRSVVLLVLYARHTEADNA